MRNLIDELNDLVEKHWILIAGFRAEHYDEPGYVLLPRDADKVGRGNVLFIQSEEPTHFYRKWNTLQWVSTPEPESEPESDDAIRIRNPFEAVEDEEAERIKAEWEEILYEDYERSLLERQAFHLDEWQTNSDDDGVTVAWEAHEGLLVWSRYKFLPRPSTALEDYLMRGAVFDDHDSDE